MTQRDERCRDLLHKSLDKVFDELMQRGMLDKARQLVFDVQQTFQIVDGELPEPEEVKWMKAEVQPQ